MDQPSAEQLCVKTANGRKKEIIIRIPIDLVNRVKTCSEQVEFWERNIDKLNDAPKYYKIELNNYFIESLAEAMKDQEAAEKELLTYIPNIIKPYVIQWFVSYLDNTFVLYVVDSENSD